MTILMISARQIVIIMHWACWYSLLDDAIDFLFENNEGNVHM